MRCQNCHRELAADEPIYRVAIGYDFIAWRERWDGHTVGSLCAYCATQSPSAAFFPDQRWRAPEPCRHCGRPVILNGRRRIPGVVACGIRCRQAVHATKWEVSPAERACPICGVIFAPKRINVIFCSRACKQRAYRNRRDHGAGAPFPWRARPSSERACPICGVTFVPKRSDAIYCSSVCLQRAYRNRRDAAVARPSRGEHNRP